MSSSGTEFVQSLPPRAGPPRERAILDAVRANNLAPFVWSSVVSAKDGRSLQLYVTPTRFVSATMPTLCGSTPAPEPRSKSPTF